MTANSSWIKHPLLVRFTGLKELYKYGESISEISKDGKFIKTDSIYDFDGDGIVDAKIFQKGSKVSVFINQNQDKGKQPRWVTLDSNGKNFKEIEQNLLEKHLTPILQKLANEKTEEKSGTNDKLQTSVYTVVPKDNLTKIAKKFGCTIEELMKLNNLKERDNIQLGQELRVPLKSSPLPIPVPSENIVKAQEQTEIVKKTEQSVLPIPEPVATKKTSIEKIHQGTKNDSIEIVTHELKNGQTLGDLSKIYGCSVDFIKKLNNISDAETRLLRAGQSIKVGKVNLTYTKTDENNISLLKTSIMSDEGLKTKAYQCPAGKWTIGYGHTKGVKQGQTISKKEAEKYLGEDLKNAYKDLKVLLLEKGITDLDAGKTRALVDLVFNVGVEKIRNSKLMQHIKNGNYEDAQSELNYFKAGGEIQGGLIKRRIVGMKDFLGGTLTPKSQKEVIKAINIYLGTKASSWSEAIKLLYKHGKMDLAIIMQQLPNIANN